MSLYNASLEERFEEFLKLVDQNKFEIVDKTEFVNNRSRIRILCKEHSVEFTNVVGDIKKRGRVSGCKECLRSSGRNSSLSREERLQIFKSNLSKHPDFNNLEFPNLDNEFVSIKKKIHCYCKIHKFDFYTVGSNLTSLFHRCPKCAMETRKTVLSSFKGKNSPLLLPLNEAIRKAVLKHNNKYDYSLITEKVWEGMNHKYEIICPEHGIFKQNFGNHISLGNGCPKCANASMKNSLSKGKDHYIEIFNFVHNNKYDYSLIEKENLKSSDKIKIICPEHGIFEQNVGNHRGGQKCPKCALNDTASILADQKLLLNSEYIKRAKEVHLGKYDYSLIDPNEKIGCMKKVPIICPEHGKFEQSWTCHIHMAEGCPRCNDSKMERELARKLNALGVKYEREKEFDGLVGVYGKPLRFDFYLPDNNLCIECDGIQHHQYVPELHQSEKSFEIQIEHDRRKTEFCKKNGIKLKRLTEKDFS